MSHLPLAGLGQRSAAAHRELEALGLAELTPARVLAQHSDRWLVAEILHDPGDDAAAPHALGGAPQLPPRLLPARGRLRAEPGGTPVAGDWVGVDPGGAIAVILERRGTITRRRPGEPTEAQLLASGVDLALIVEPADGVNARRAERLVALAAAGGVEPLLVVSKADVEPESFTDAARLARGLGLAEAFPVSAVDGEGLGALRQALAPGATAVLLGASGVGKSTLANALVGSERMATGAVRVADGRGRHTTVTRELLPLPSGALLIDVPGLREVGLWDGGHGGAFDEIEALATNCRFGDCAHDGEAGCAVAPVVAPERLAAWRKLAREQAWVDDRRAASRAREERGRSYVRLQREARAAKGNRKR
ncbi:MAG: ribosome small subunit-dependent GTPase A [Patulibacter sp.]